MRKMQNLKIRSQWLQRFKSRQKLLISTKLFQQNVAQSARILWSRLRLELRRTKS